MASIVASSGWLLLRAEGPTLTLFAGDTFFGGETHGPAGGESQDRRALAQAGQDRLSADALAEILKDVDIDAAILGHHDREELERAERLAGVAELPLVGQSETATRAIEVAGVRVIVAGVAESSPDEARQALESALSSESPADLVIVMTYGGRRLARTLARVGGVDIVVLGGEDSDDAIPPATAGDALLLHASRQGQGVTIADVYVRPRSGGVQDLSEWSVSVRGESLDADIRDLEQRLERWEREGADAAQVQRQRQRLARMRAERESLAPPPLSETGIAVRARFDELAPEAPQSEDVTAAMRELARRINAHNQEAFADWTPEPPAEGEPSFIGSEACGSCHETALRWWRGHPHGRAYSTLTTRDKQFNLSCVGCHVTGYLEPGGSTITHLREGALENVGCENCHGPGSAHASSGGAVAIARTEVPEALCVRCHNEEHSDRFVYEVFRRMILVPGHGLPENE